MANNKEMGVLIDRNDPADTQLFEEAMREVDFINETSQRFDFGLSKPQSINQPEVKKSVKLETKGKQVGYCIRTGTEIPFNVEKPMSYDAFKSWSKYGDSEYAEKFCHFLGEPSKGETSVSRPILKKNWKKAKEAYGL